MTKDLIEVPDFNVGSILYLTSVNIYVNGKVRSSADLRWLLGRHNPIAKECNRFFSKFIFKTEHGDPLEPLWKIKRKYPKLKYTKFISKKKEKFEPEYIHGNVDEWHCKVAYIEIREPLITYLRSKVKKEDIELVNKLQELFINKSTHLSWDEFIKSKAKFLSELDLSNYVAELNEQTNKKIKINK